MLIRNLVRGPSEEHMSYFPAFETIQYGFNNFSIKQWCKSLQLWVVWAKGLFGEDGDEVLGDAACVF